MRLQTNKFRNFTKIDLVSYLNWSKNSVKMSANGKKSYEIKGLTSMLEKCLKRKVISYSLKCLTKPGDNFGSCMQSLDVAVAGEDKPDKVKKKHCLIDRVM